MDAFLSSFMTSLDPLNLLLMAVCAVIGVIFGAIPGLSGGMGMTLILPLTFGMAMYNGFNMLLGMYVGGISGSFIAAVLVGIPGSASSIATCYDGYPMSQKGQTSKALALGIICSFMGTFFSVIVAMLLSGPIADLALKLGPWELFSLCFCAVVLVASLSRGNAVKGLIGAGVGLLAACVGMDPVTASLRFTFNSVYVQGGIDMVAAMLGIFALLQVAADFAKGSQKLPEVTAKDLRGIGVTLRDEQNNPNGFVQISVIPSRLEVTEENMEIGNILSGIRMGNGGVVFAVNKEDGAIAYHPNSRYIGRDAYAYGITEDAMVDGYTGYVTFAGTRHFASALETDHYIVFAAVPEANIGTARLPVTLMAGAASLVALLLVILMLCLYRDKPGKAVHKGKEEKKYGKTMVDVVMPDGSVKKTESAASR